MTKKRSFRRLPSAGVVMAMIIALLVVPLAGSAFADSPDPKDATMVGTAVANPDGTNTLTLSGKWDWSRGCNERVVGWEVDWNDPNQAGNVVGPNGNGIQVDVGAAQANSLNPADNLIDQKGLANCQSGGSGSTGDWGPISHTYAASVTSVSVCVVVYDVKPEKIGTGETGKHSTVAGGPGRNTDNSLEENFNDLHEVCETKTFLLADPKIHIEKSGPATAVRGTTITYTMDVSIPSGTVPLSNVSVTDPNCNSQPTRLTGAASGDTNNDNILQTTETWHYSCQRTVASNAPSPLPNTATATGTGNNKTATDTDDHSVTLSDPIVPGINIDKSGPASGVVGQSVTYTLVVTSTTTAPIHDVVVTDNKCNSVPILQSKAGDQDNDLEPNEAWTYTCSRVLLSTDAPTLTNIASVTGKGPNNENVSDTDTHNLTVNSGSAIVIDKTGPATAARNSTITYTLKVSIPVDRPLTNVVVSDPRCNAAPVRTSQSPGDADEILEFGEVWTYTCTHVVTQTDPDPLPNTATVTGKDDTNATVTDTDDHTVDIDAQPAAGVTIEKTGPATAGRGDTITYTLKVSIPIDRPLTNVVVSDPRCNAAPVRTSQSPGDVDEILEFGEVWTYTCTHLITANDPDPLPNTATVTGKDDTNTSVTDTDDHTVDVADDVDADIVIEKNGPQEATVGDNIEYTLKVSIAVDRPLTNVVVTDPVCDTSPALQGKTGGDADATLELGEVWTYTCEHRVTAGDPDPLPNTATASGDDDDGNTVTDQDSHLVDVSPKAELKVKKDGPDQATVGDNVTFVIEVSTPVDHPLSDIDVSDPKCDEAPQLDSKNGGDNDNLLELGEVWTYTCKHVMTEADVGLFRNTTTVEGKDVDGEKVKDDDDHVVEVGAVKGIRFNQPPPPPPGVLPFTGSEPTTWLLFGVLSALSGAWMLWTSRKYELKAYAKK